MGGIRGHGGGGSPRCSAWAVAAAGPGADAAQHASRHGGEPAGRRDGDRVHGTRPSPDAAPARGGLGLHPHPVQRRRGRRHATARARRAAAGRRSPTAAEPAHHGLGRGQPRAGHGALRLRGPGPPHRLHPRDRRHARRHPVLRAGLDEGRQGRRGNTDWSQARWRRRPTPRTTRTSPRSPRRSPSAIRTSGTSSSGTSSRASGTTPRAAGTTRATPSLYNLVYKALKKVDQRQSWSAGPIW